MMKYDTLENKLRERYPDMDIYRDAPDRIRISAESGTELDILGLRMATKEERKDYKGWPLADYYDCQSWDSYQFGIHGGFCRFVEKLGFFCEWHNAGEFGLYRV